MQIFIISPLFIFHTFEEKINHCLIDCIVREENLLLIAIFFNFSNENIVRIMIISWSSYCIEIV